MEAKELIRAGRLSEARKLLTEEVKKLPGDLSKRTLLFQVLAFSGEWGKAQSHLEIIANQDSRKGNGGPGFQEFDPGRKTAGGGPETQAASVLPAYLTPSMRRSILRPGRSWGKKRFGKPGNFSTKIDADQPMVSGIADGKAFDRLQGYGLLSLSFPGSHDL